MQSHPIQVQKPARAATTCRSESVTVVVPVRNEELYIARTLDQLLSQDVTGIDLEIVVVDGQSTDRTRQIVERYSTRNPRVRLLDNPGRLSSAARNLAIRESCGEYVIVVDGHCEIPSRRYLLDLVDAFQESGADCLGRPQPLDVSQATTLQQAIAAARSSWLGHHPDSFIYSDREVDCPAASVAVAYRRAVFETVGTFDERFDACEDYELNCRIDLAGLRCRLIPKLTVRYEPRKTLGELFRQLFRYGRGRVRLFRKHRPTLAFRTLAPAAFVAGIAAGPLLSTAMPFLWTYYIAALFVYVAVTMIESLRLALAKNRLRLLGWLPVVFWMIHFGSGCGLLWELAHRRSMEPSSP